MAHAKVLNDVDYLSRYDAYQNHYCYRLTDSHLPASNVNHGNHKTEYAGKTDKTEENKYYITCQ